MQTQKMSLANMHGRLSRAEMKNIMAGRLYTQKYQCCINSECTPCSTNQGQCGPKATLKTC